MRTRARLAIAFVAAPLIVAAGIAMLLAGLGVLNGGAASKGLEFGLAVLLVAGVFGVGSSVLIGVPAYLFLRGRFRPSGWAAMAAGGGVGCVSAVVMGLLAITQGSSATALFGALPLMLLFGAVGGIVFWAIAAPALVADAASLAARREEQGPVS